MDFKMITILKLHILGLFVCSAHAMFTKGDTDSQLSEFERYSKYYESACQGKPLCNDSTIVQPNRSEEGYYKCACDPECSIYGDCCPDAQTNNFPAKSGSWPKFTCIPEMKFYVVETCPTSFADIVTRMKCENITWGDAYEDVKIMRPVMDRTSRVTYLNAYCALCNYVTNYERFGLAYRCFSFTNVTGQEYSLMNVAPPAKVLPLVKFDPESKTFTATANGTFYKCSHSVLIPTHLEPYLRGCLPDTISSCPKTFNDSNVVEKCQSSTYYIVYDSIFNGSGKSYRNKYCAMCNGVQEVVQCQMARTESGSASMWMSSSSGSCDGPIMRQLPVCQ